jgi:hypothetical protein
MVDVAKGSDLIWCVVAEHKLRARAARDGVPTGLELAALFERYREYLEQRASDAYDAGKWVVAPNGIRFIYIEI